MNSPCGQSESGVARAIVGSDSVSRFLPPPNKGRSTSSKNWINMYSQNYLEESFFVTTFRWNTLL